MPFVYMVLAGFSFFVVYKKINKDALHPVALLLVVWFISASIASLQWGMYQHPWPVSVHIMVIFCGLICLLFGYISIRKTKNAITNILKERTVNDTYKYITRFILIISFSFVILTFIRNGMNISYLRQLSGADLKSEVAENLVGISSIESYFINLFPFCAIFSFFEIVYSKKDERKLVYNFAIIGLVVVYCAFVIYSRGTLLYIMLGCLYIFNSKHKLGIKYIIILGLCVIAILGVLMISRVFEGSIVFSGVKNLKNPILASAYNYIAYSFENFSEIVQKGSRYKIVGNVFQSAYKLIGIYNNDQIITHEIARVFNSTTWLSAFYDDLGFIGTLLYPGIICAFLSKAYNKSKENIYYVLFLAVLQKAIVVTFFGNYFLTSLSVMFPYIITGLICFISKKYIIRIPRLRLRLRKIS